MALTKSKLMRLRKEELVNIAKHNGIELQTSDGREPLKEEYADAILLFAVNDADTAPDLGGDRGAPQRSSVSSDVSVPSGASPNPQAKRKPKGRSARVQRIRDSQS